ncbi:unnamed protein product, partial [Prunus brigantina]
DQAPPLLKSPVVSGINRGSSFVYKGFLSYFKRVLFIKALRLVGWLHCVFFNWVLRIFELNRFWSLVVGDDIIVFLFCRSCHTVLAARYHSLILRPVKK